MRVKLVAITEDEAAVLFRLIQKPNPIDDYVSPIRAIRAKMALITGGDPNKPRTGK